MGESGVCGRLLPVHSAAGLSRMVVTEKRARFSYISMGNSNKTGVTHLIPRAWAFHGGNRGSNPLGDAIPSNSCGRVYRRAKIQRTRACAADRENDSTPPWGG